MVTIGPTPTTKQTADIARGDVRNAVIHAVDKRLDEIARGGGGGMFHGTLAVEVTYQNGRAVVVRGSLTETVKLG